MITTHVDVSEKISGLIDAVLEKELSEEFDRAIKRFNERKGEIIAGVLLNTQKIFHAEIHGQNIVFTVREISKPE